VSENCAAAVVADHLVSSCWYGASSKEKRILFLVRKPEVFENEGRVMPYPGADDLLSKSNKSAENS